MCIKKKKNKSKESAFSLLELAIVMIIIGLLAVGVTGGQRLITKAKFSRAKMMTVTSPIPDIDNLILWFEFTLDDLSDGSWDDSGLKGLDAVDQCSPSATSIGAGGFTAVGGANEQWSFKVEKSFPELKNNGYATAYTVFMVVTTPESSNGNSEQDIIMGADNTEIRIGFDSINKTFYSDENPICSGYDPSGDTYELGQSYILVMYRPNNTCCSNKLTELNINSPTCGEGSEDGFQGTVSEIIFFKEEMASYPDNLLGDGQEVVDYLSKKYSIKKDPVFLDHGGGC